jgi:hypothetical protein
MKRQYSHLVAMSLLGILLMPGKLALSDDTITAGQFQRLIELLSHVDSGKTTLLAVQGGRTIEVTEFTLMKQISASEIKTVFYLKNDKTGEKKQIAIFDPSETGKSLSRGFWGLICKGAGVCHGCTELFGDNPCK